MTTWHKEDRMARFSGDPRIERFESEFRGEARTRCSPAAKSSTVEPETVPGWEIKLRKVQEWLAETLLIRQEFLRVKTLVSVHTRELAELKSKIAELESKSGEQWVPIQSLAPEPYVVLKEFKVVVRPTGEEDEYSARFPDANLQSYGSNQSESLRNLKSLILDVFDSLSSRPSGQLGPNPRTQLAVLREFIKKQD